MPASYRIDTELGVIFSEGRGVLTDDDVFAHQSSATTDPDFDRSLNQLWDLRHVDRVEVTVATLRKLAAARSFQPNVKRALVAPNDLVFGMARMFQALHEDAGEDFRVFRDVADARSWLGLG